MDIRALPYWRPKWKEDRPMSDGIWVTRVRPDVYYRYEALDNTS
jgi:hypothetical protein